jgi:hypothetical protein
MYNEGEADEARQLELESIEEACCTALVQSAQYLQGIRRYHDRNVRERPFSIGDLVLRRIQDESGLHKLNTRWEGPFIIKQVTRPGVISTTIPRGPRRPKFLERSEPAQVLPVRRRAGIAVLRTPRRPFSSESIWRLRVTKFGLQILSVNIRRLQPRSCSKQIDFLS